MLIGGVGTVLGVCLGVITCLLLKRYQFIELDSDVYYITTLPVQLEWLDVILIAGAALAICYLATIYPASPASKVNPEEAIRLSRRCCELTGFEQPLFMDTLAVAYAAAGRFAEAIETAKRAIGLAESSDQTGLAEQIRGRLRLYQAGEPYYQPRPSPEGIEP